MDAYYRTTNANVHRGIYRLSEDATQAYEDARRRCGPSSTRPRGARSCSPRNATESINLVAQTWAGQPGAQDAV
jgi:cysteine desulfurase/selenocysteine lyase